VLSNLTEDDPESASPDAAFVQGLRQLNWIDGRNVQSNIAMRLPIPLAFAALQWNWRGSGPTSSSPTQARMAQPAAINSASCALRSWPFVLTRAYPNSGIFLPLQSCHFRG
jgi:hypothetical protein